MNRLLYFLIPILCILLSSCAASSEPKTPETSPTTYQFTDDLNREVLVELPVKNVVCLYGSYSEVWTLAGGTLKGITDDVTDRHILEDDTIKLVGSTKTPNIELILALQPNLVLLNPNISEQLELADVLKSSGIQTAYFDVEQFEDYLHLLKIATDLNDTSDMYETYGTRLAETIQSTLDKTTAAKDKKILLLRAFSSNVKARGTDNMTGQMLKQFGTLNITDIYPSILEELSSEIIMKEDPDYIFVTTMGNDTEKAIQKLEDMILNHPAYQNLSAIKNNRVYVLPKDLFHYKPNQRWDEAYDYLAQILNK